MLAAVASSSSSSSLSLLLCRQRAFRCATSGVIGQWRNRHNILSAVNPNRNTSWSTQSHYLRWNSNVTKDGENNDNPIRILYASQTGTAHVFSLQLMEALEDEFPSTPVTVEGWNEASSPDQLLQTGQTHIFLASVTGVGEPPDNGRAFFEWIQNKDNENASKTASQSLEYAVFGLGNQKAHPNHYNVIGKTLDARLQELGAKPILEIGLGDEGDCIEDDFENWMDALVKQLKNKDSSSLENDNNAETATTESQGSETSEQIAQTNHKEEASSIHDSTTANTVQCLGAKFGNERLKSEKYPVLTLEPPEFGMPRQDLLDLQTDTPFYEPGSVPMEVVGNQIINPMAGETGLRKLRVSLDNDKNLSYETGDHLMIYPQNSDCMVEAYLNLLDVHPHAIVSKEQQEKSSNNSNNNYVYPYPTGLTVYETLRHCVDLSAVPSPAVSRTILGRSDINYKQDVAYPRRTVLDMLCESGLKFALEDILYSFLPPLKPRYYSIASSNLVHPREIYLTYRKVKYVTSRGALRQGVCSNYMTHLGSTGQPISDDYHLVPHIVCKINYNPGFRLPPSNETPILLIAGGCGIAPIRAFIEERIELSKDPNQGKLGPAKLFLGFRSPLDEVYQSMVEEALNVGALTESKVSYSASCHDNERCMLVSELVRSQGAKVFEHLEQGGYTYLCGGARTFGAAIERELLDIIAKHGNMSHDEATAYVRNLVKEGRLCEDLAD